MTLKEALDKLTQIIRMVQYASDSFNNTNPEELSSQLQDFLILVGQALVERDQAEEQLKDLSNRLWMNHVKGELDCPCCKSQIPVEFFVGSKGMGTPIAAQTKDELIQKLEFPPITVSDLDTIPDYLPDTF